jgi:hypothetical protein
MVKIVASLARDFNATERDFTSLIPNSNLPIICDDRTIIYQIWRDLDITLVAITPAINGETWLQFCARVRQNESAAYRSWQTEQWRKMSDGRFNASRPRFDTTRREYSGRQDNTGFMRPQTTGNRINNISTKGERTTYGKSLTPPHSFVDLLVGTSNSVRS